MKVVHVIGSVAPRYGGPTVAVLHICSALARRGHDVRLLTTDNDGRGTLDVPLGTPINQDGYRITYYPVQRPRSYLLSWPLLRAMWAEFRDADVVDIHSLYRFHSQAGARLARKLGVPYVVRPHGTLDTYHRRHHAGRKSLYWPLLERPLLNAATAMHYTSTKEQIEAEQAGVHAPGYIVPLGVDIAEFRAAKQFARGSRQILFLGRLTKKKRVDIAIRAFALVHREMPDARLVIAGDDDDGLRRGLQQLCADLLIEGAVRFAGRVDGPAKMELLGTSAVFVLPSEDESFGIAVVEAMASGMPVVISPDVALHDEISAADAGIVVQRDPAEVARAMMDYLRSPQKRATAGQNAVQLVERRFTWDACAEGLEAMYEDMISKTGGRSQDSVSLLTRTRRRWRGR